MSCDCIDKVGEAIEKKQGEYEFTNLAISINFQTGKEKVRPPCIEYNYHPKKIDGTPSKKIIKGYIGYSYCPICGTKYED